MKQLSCKYLLLFCLYLYANPIFANMTPSFANLPVHASIFSQRLLADKSGWGVDRRLTTFDSLVQICEDVTFQDKSVAVIADVIPQMRQIANEQGGVEERVCCLYWEAWALAENGDRQLVLLDSALQLIDTVRNLYGYHRIQFLRGGVLRYKGDYLQAYQLLQSARDFFAACGDRYYQARADVFNGMVLRDIGDYEMALEKLEAASEVFEQIGCISCIIKNKLNIGTVLYFLGKKEEAYQVLLDIVQNPIAREDTSFLINTMVSILRASDYQDNRYVDTAVSLAFSANSLKENILALMGKGADYLIRQKNDSAAIYYAMVLDILNKNPLDISYYMPIYHAYTELYKRKGDFDSAYFYLERYVVMRDSLLQQEQWHQYQMVEIRQMIHDMQSRVREQTERNRWYRMVTGFIILILLIVGSMGMYILSMSRKKERISKQLKESENRELLLRNEKIKYELDIKNRELTSISLGDIEKNKVLQGVLQDAEALLEHKRIAYPEGSKLTHQLKNLLKDSNEWTFFKIYFEGVHPRFFVELKENNPKLSENDLRICALIRIGMATKEIAQILRVNINTVFTIRYRIRKKINDIGKLSLEDYLRRL